MDGVEWARLGLRAEPHRKRKTSDGPCGGEQQRGSPGIEDDERTPALSRVQEEEMVEMRFTESNTPLTTHASGPGVKRRSSMSVDGSALSITITPPEQEESQRISIGGGLSGDSVPPSLVPPSPQARGVVSRRPACSRVLLAVLTVLAVLAGGWLLTSPAAAKVNAAPAAAPSPSAGDAASSASPSPTSSSTSSSTSASASAPASASTAGGDGALVAAALGGLGSLAVCCWCLRRQYRLHFESETVLMVHADDDLHSIIEKAHEQWQAGRHSVDGVASPHLVPSERQRAWAAQNIVNV